MLPCTVTRDGRRAVTVEVINYEYFRSTDSNDDFSAVADDIRACVAIWVGFFVDQITIGEDVVSVVALRDA